MARDDSRRQGLPLSQHLDPEFVQISVIFTVLHQLMLADPLADRQHLFPIITTQIVDQRVALTRVPSAP